MIWQWETIEELYPLYLWNWVSWLNESNRSNESIRSIEADRINQEYIESNEPVGNDSNNNYVREVANLAIE